MINSVRSFCDPFDSDFDMAKWLVGIKAFNHFGIGLATIYLNRVYKKRFPIQKSYYFKYLSRPSEIPGAGPEKNPLLQR